MSDYLGPLDCGRPGFPVHHQLLELAQTHIHRVCAAIQHLILCHPLLLLPSIFPSIRFFFPWFSSSHQVAKVLELQLQHQSFLWIFRTYFLNDWLVWSPCSPRDSQESSPMSQFKSINIFLIILFFLFYCKIYMCIYINTEWYLYIYGMRFAILTTLQNTIEWC